MRKIFSAAFILGLSFQVAFASFSDVDQSDENFDAINYVESNGIVEGYDDGTYRPDNTINRAEFTKIIIESQFSDQEIDACLTDHGDELVFPDVPHSEWYAKYVCVAFDQDIVSGYPDGSYGPANEISIVEAAKIIVNAFGYETTSDEIWYKPYMVEMGDRAALPTTILSFEQSITRGEMAEMIYRLLAEITTKDSTSYEELAGEEVAVQEFTVTAEDYSFSLTELTVNEGDTVRITFENEGSHSHNFSFADLDWSTSTLSSGESETLEFTAPSAGMYTFYCSIAGHREAGMEGTMTVNP